jgi:hypothetical protein
VTHVVLPREGTQRFLDRLRPSLAETILSRMPSVEIHLVARPDT